MTNPPSETERKDATGSHDLKNLLCRLQQGLNDLGYTDALPQEFSELVNQFTVLEEGAPDRFRYSKIRDKKKNLQHSFPEDQAIPVVDIQHKLEAALTEAFQITEGASETLSLLESLGYELLELDQELYARSLL